MMTTPVPSPSKGTRSPGPSRSGSAPASPLRSPASRPHNLNSCLVLQQGSIEPLDLDPAAAIEPITLLLHVVLSRERLPTMAALEAINAVQTTIQNDRDGFMRDILCQQSSIYVLQVLQRYIGTEDSDSIVVVGASLECLEQLLFAPQLATGTALQMLSVLQEFNMQRVILDALRLYGDQHGDIADKCCLIIKRSMGGKVKWVCDHASCDALLHCLFVGHATSNHKLSFDYCSLLELIIASDPTAISLLVQRGVCEEIVAHTMHTFQDSLPLITICCGIIHHMASHSMEHHTALIETDVWLLITDLLFLYYLDRPCMSLCCSILASLPFPRKCDAGHSQLSSALTENLARVMEAHADATSDDQSQLLEQACLVVSHLASASEDCREEMGSGGMCEILVLVLKLQVGHPAIIAGCCAAIWSLVGRGAECHEDVRYILQYVGAAEAIVDAVAAHMENVHVTHPSCALITLLVDDFESKMSLVYKENACSVFVHLLEGSCSCTDDEEKSGSRVDLATCRATLAVLVDLCSIEEAAVCLERSGLVDSLLRILSQPHWILKENSIGVLCCRLLYSMSAFDSTNTLLSKHIILATSLLCNLFNSRQHQVDGGPLLAECFLFIISSSRCEENARLMASRADLMECLIATYYQYFIGDAALSESFCEAVSGAVSLDVLAMHESIAMLLTSLAYTHMQSPPTALAISDAIAALATSLPVRKGTLVRCGVVSVLTDCIQINVNDSNLVASLYRTLNALGDRVQDTDKHAIFRLIVSTLQSHRAAGIVVKAACSLVSTVCYKNAVAQALFRSMEFWDALGLAMMTQRDDLSCILACCKAVMDVSYEQCWAYFGSLDLWQAFTEAMAVHKQHLAAMELMCTMVVTVASNRLLLFQNGCVDRLVDVMNTHKFNMELMDIVCRGIDLVQMDGHTSLHLAAQHGHGHIISMMVAKGCDINAETDDQRTALQIARECGQYDTASTLLKLGAQNELP